MPFLYRLCSDETLSTARLHKAIQQVVIKHQSLHTSLVFNKENNLLIQKLVDITDNNDNLFEFIESTFETDEQLNNIMHVEQYDPQLFDLSQGLVFRCHFVYYKQISSNQLLSDKDALIFNFHHALFDFPSMDIFLHDLNQAYTASQLSIDNNTTLSYPDCIYKHIISSFHIKSLFSSYLDSVIEQEMPMTGASMFWLDTLHNCKLDQSLPLPFDRYRLSDEQQLGHRTTVSFTFGQDLSHDALTYASSHNISIQHLTLATYYIFLFKLTNGESDLCIGMNINNRYHDELKSIIGLFENIIPLRCQLDPHCSFHQLIKHVCEITTNAMKYSYFPLQRILNQHPNVTRPAFLNIFFDFQSNQSENNKNEVMIGDARLHPMSNSLQRSKHETTNKLDFSLLIEHDLNVNQFSCTVNASLDLFHVETVDKIVQRFHSMLDQLFHVIDDQMKKPVYELSLISSDERILMKSINHTQVLFSSVTCIHHEFVCQVMKHPQKLAVELDDQSLTYCELLHCVQVLSLNLMNKYAVVPGEIVCQCVERSLSMVS